jgi:signal transduction histidine kinase
LQPNPTVDPKKPENVPSKMSVSKGHKIRVISLRLLLWCFLSHVHFTDWSHASSTIIDVANAPSRQQVTSRTELFEDSSRQTTIDMVRRAGNWRQGGGQALNFGLSSSIWWVRLHLRNTDAQPHNVVLDFGTAVQDYVDWYLFDAKRGERARGRTGDRVPFGLRPLNSSILAVPLQLEGHTEMEVYLRLDSHDGLYEVMPLVLADLAEFTQYNKRAEILQMLFHGGLLSLICFSLFLFIATRQLSAGFYMLYLSGFLVYSFSIRGFDLQYLWPDAPDWHNQFVLIAATLCFVFGNGFGITVLRLRHHVPPSLWKTIQVFFVLNILTLVPILLDFYAVAVICGIFGVALILIMTGTSLCLAFRGVRDAGYVSGGFVIMIVAAGMLYLQLLGATGPSDVNVIFSALQIGAGIQFMIFPFILARSHQRLEIEKAQSEMEAEETRRHLAAQHQFLGFISHELRTPLAIIDSAAQVLPLLYEDTPSMHRKTASIRAAAQRLTRLLNNCLTDDRLSTKGLQPEFFPIDTRELLQSLVGQFQVITENHQIQADLDNIPSEFCGDAMLIEVMIGNLLDNAVKYSPAGGTIILRGWSKQHGELLVDVQDCGVGISPEQRSRVFDRFYRATQIPGISGAGLGLSLVQQIASLHGGEVTCISEPGRGSTFTVSLRSASSRA